GSQAFTATATFTDGSTMDVTALAIWYPSDMTIATTSGATATGVADGTTFINADYTDPYYTNIVTGTTGFNVGLAAANPIVVSPTPVTVPLGQPQQFTATGNFTDSVQRDITGAVNWGSSNAGVATVDAFGSTTTLTAGTTNIMAASTPATTGSASLTVGPLQLQSIDAEPAFANVTNGNSLQYSATGSYSDGSTQDLTLLVTWTSLDTTIATITSGNFGGVATGDPNNVGTTSITAQYTDPNYSSNPPVVSNTDSLSVGPPNLVSIAVTPANPTLILNTNQQFTATGQYDDGSTADLTATASWASDTPGVATVSATGLASAVGAGSANVSATDPTTLIAGSTPVTVISAQVTSIDVSPPSATINVEMQQQYTATGHYDDGTSHDITAIITWKSSSSSVAGINPGGLATGANAGTTNITATLGSVTNNPAAVLNVNAPTLVSIAVTPANPTVTVNSQVQFTATATFNDNSTQDITNTAAWSADNSLCAPACIAVNNTTSKGLAVARAAGTAKVIATQSNKSGTTNMTVTGGVLQTITISPLNYSLRLSLHQPKQFTATGHYSDGSTQDLTDSVSWSSSQTFVATISSTGSATPKNIGKTTITATIVLNGTHSASTSLTVIF
ncbi:MAG TPA: Ig-like domain-containing protein, partial [Terriglobales bacterium]|nr:Ig-like domain-containing protein [Terriglobales bacterium]